MGWDGAGGYTRQHNFSADASANIKILAARMDAELDDFASAMTLAWARNGQNTPTADIPMGGQKFINVGAATSVGNFMRVREFVENVPVFMTDAESSTDRISVSAQYFTSVSANQAPGDGTRIVVRAGSDKSSAALYLNGHSANVEYQDGNIIGPALVSGGVYEFIYSSVDTAWKIKNPDNGRTAAEIAAGVTVTDRRYPPLNVLRYGANTTPGTTDMTAAIQAAVDVGAQMGAPGYLPAEAGECRITTSISIAASRTGLVGDGKGLSRILAVGCAGFSCGAGLSFLQFRGFTVARSVRYTTTPHSDVGIGLNGTTASKCLQPAFYDLFIDGFHTAISLGCTDSALLHGVIGDFLFKGVTSTGQSLNNTIANCQFSGGGAAGSRGVDCGDGVLDQEGWNIHHCLFYDFQRAASCNAVLAFTFESNICDAIGDIGVYLASSATAPAINNRIRSNYIAFKAGSAANAGILAVNDYVAATAQNNGTSYEDNEILAYATATVGYGISLEGDDDIKAVIRGNRIKNASTADIRLVDTATKAIVEGNQCYGAGYQFAVGADPSFSDTNRGTMITTLVTDVASAAALTLPVGPRLFKVTGTTSVTSIVTTGLMQGIYVLQFADALTFTDGSNLLLEGDFTTGANDTITLMFDGTNFREIARSNN